MIASLAGNKYPEPVFDYMDYITYTILYQHTYFGESGEYLI